MSLENRGYALYSCIRSTIYGVLPIAIKISLESSGFSERQAVVATLVSTIASQVFVKFSSSDRTEEKLALNNCAVSEIAALYISSYFNGFWGKLLGACGGACVPLSYFSEKFWEESERRNPDPPVRIIRIGED